LEQTDSKLPKEFHGKVGSTPAAVLLRAWDQIYKQRARLHPVVLICDVLFRELLNPPVISRQDWEDWCGGVPATRTPPEIDEDLWKNLCERAGIAA
jgi:hypothetical protein